MATRSIGSIPWAVSWARCSGLSRRARIPPWIFGWRVFTRPSSISGNPVTSNTSRTFTPESRSSLAVPPVERISTPRAESPRTNSTTPVLSCTLTRARRTRVIGSPIRRSFDHLVGPDEDRLRNGEAEGLRRLEVDHQLELRRLLHGEVRRLGALENLVDVVCRAPHEVRSIRRVGHEAAGLNGFGKLGHRGEPGLQGESGNPCPLSVEDRASRNYDDGARALPAHPRESAIYLVWLPRVVNLQLGAPRPGGGPHAPLPP